MCTVPDVCYWRYKFFSAHIVGTCLHHSCCLILQTLCCNFWQKKTRYLIWVKQTRWPITNFLLYSSRYLFCSDFLPSSCSSATVCKCNSSPASLLAPTANHANAFKSATLFFFKSDTSHTSDTNTFAGVNTKSTTRIHLKLHAVDTRKKIPYGFH